MPQPHIVVVGSLNMDLVVQVPTIPAPGETVLGDNFATIPGGKGANQAVAAARLGAKVSLIGRVGADAFGAQLLAAARAEGIDVTHVGVDETAASGIAMITVDAAGQNSIAVASGANYRLTAVHVHRAWEQLDRVDLLVMPLETPLETIETAVMLAQQSGVKVILNPAPARPLPAHILAGVDVLVPNESETALLTGLPVTTGDETRQAARCLLDLGVGSVVLTLGSRGALVLAGGNGEFTAVAPYPVNAVDTTAAGDAFVAGLAVGLGEGRSLPAAAQFANAVGALAVTKQGAQPAMPTRAEVETLSKS
ncbi:MAG: ribokinase [Chloroflexi bacterium]|nr:ribokinase [Chloroflexota bacterium]